MNYKKLVVISKNHVAKNGNKFKSYFTPVKVKGAKEEKLITIKFGEGINKSKFPNRLLVVVREDKISSPKTFEPYHRKKDGKLVYPYFYIEEIEKWNEIKTESKPTEFEFSVEDSEFDEIPSELSEDEIPF